MTAKRRFWFFTGVFLCALVALLAVVLSGPKYPVAIVRVVDASGAPVAGAVVSPAGLRTKAGPFAADWYSWGLANLHEGPKVVPVTTDANGLARIPYPKHVFERIETGTIILTVSHPDFVTQRPERVVSTAPAYGAPLRDWVNYFVRHVKHLGGADRPHHPSSRRAIGNLRRARLARPPKAFSALRASAGKVGTPAPHFGAIPNPALSRRESSKTARIQSALSRLTRRRGVVQRRH